MRWKLILGIFLVALLAGLLYYRHVTFGPIDISNIRLPNAFAILTGSIIPKEYSNVVLETSKKYLTNQKFQLINTTLKVNGICIGSLSIGETNIDLSNNPCNITIYSPEGDILVTNSGSVVIKSKFGRMIVNDLKIISPAEANFEVLPYKLIGSIKSNEIKFEAYEGSIKELTALGQKLSEIYFPPCKNPKVYDFIGSLNLNGDYASISGVASKIEYRCK